MSHSSTFLVINVRLTYNSLTLEQSNGICVLESQVVDENKINSFLSWFSQTSDGFLLVLVEITDCTFM